MSAEAVPGPLLLTKLGDWTLDDLAHLPDDGRRYEIVDGSLLVSPPPTNFHQGLAFRMATMLQERQPTGYRVITPGSVELGPHHFRQPDVLLVAAAAVASMRPLAAAPGDVLLTIEIMSPGSITEDRITKPAVYARAGIPHYWRLEVGADGHELSLCVYRLVGDVYAEAAIFRGDESVEIDVPVRLRFRLAQLLG